MPEIKMRANGGAWFRSGVHQFAPDHLSVGTDSIELRSGGAAQVVVVEVVSAGGTSHWLTLEKAEAQALATEINRSAAGLP